MKRFVIILLALLSGLSVPQAVAVAAGRADASVIAAQPEHRVAQQRKAVLGVASAPATAFVAQDKVVPFAGPAPVAPRTVYFGDRARE